MKRREILKYTAYYSGAALSAPLVSALLSGCNTSEIAKDGDYELQFFNKKEFDFVKKLIDTILPKTDSPSASEVGVHKIIDSMIGKVYTNEVQSVYKQGFDALYNHLKKEKLSALNLLESADSNIDPAIKKAYLEIKQQAVAYYLTTEEIGKNYLNYLPVPGEYQACISLEEQGGKAWTL